MKLAGIDDLDTAAPQSRFRSSGSAGRTLQASSRLSDPATILADNMLELATPVQYIKGVGPRIAEILAVKGIHTVGDLLHYLPFRYEDRLNPRGIGELRAGEMATVIGEVRNSGLFRTRRMPIFQLTVGQGRSRLRCLWFNATYLQGKFTPGQMIALYGKVEEDIRTRELQIMQPQFEMLGESEGGENDRPGTPQPALVSPRDSHCARQSDAGSARADSCHRTLTTRPHLAARRVVERALARAGREFSGSAIFAHACTHSPDLRRTVLRGTWT
jgi:RecG wedge domain